jgi:hypothetical protein
VKNVESFVFDEDGPYGEGQVRQAHLQAGDVVAVVVQSREGTHRPCPSSRRSPCRASWSADRPPRSFPGRAHLAKRAGPGPTKLGSGPVYLRTAPRSTRSTPVEIFFETLLVLVCVGVLAFAYLTVKKLYQGQR